MKNLDATTLRLVAKGLTVTLAGKTGEVVKLCNGSALVRWQGERYASPEWCKELTVKEAPKALAS